MRWDSLFDDLEIQLEQGVDAEEHDLRAEEERLRLGRLSLRDRILAVHRSYGRHDDYGLQLMLVSGSQVTVRITSIGLDWLSGDIRDQSATARQCVVPLDAVVALSLNREQMRRSLPTAGDKAPSTGGRAAGVPLTTVLRGLCRRRASVEVVTTTDVAFGTIDRVGVDHLDLAIHEPDGPRRESAVSGYRITSFAHLSMVRL